MANRNRALRFCCYDTGEFHQRFDTFRERWMEGGGGVEVGWGSRGWGGLVLPVAATGCKGLLQVWCCGFACRCKFERGEEGRWW